MVSLSQILIGILRKMLQRNMNRSGFFTTRTGRNIVMMLAGATTTGLFIANYVPHTFGLDRYRSFMQCYKNGAPMPVHPKILERVNEAANVLNIDYSERNLLKPFSVYGYELFSAGSTKSKYGAIIGIPTNYEVVNAEEIKSTEVCYCGNKVDWNSEAGKLLEDALVLTKDEQIFGLCKVLLQVQSNHVLINSLIPSISFILVYTIGHYMNHSLHLLQKTFGIRMCMYSLLGLFGLGTFSFMKDYNQVACDAEIDKKLCLISPKLMKAGIGFYEKQLTKNIALREIGKDKTYTKKGNFNYLIRQKSLPLTARKSFFEKEYADYLKTIS